MSLQVKKSIEALLFVHDHPITVGNLQAVLGKDVERQIIEQHLEELAREYNLADKPYTLKKIAGGWQFLTRQEYEPLLKKLLEVKKRETLSRAQLETLAVIAYSQPITKSEVDGIRGVNCSPTIKVLQDRDLIRVTGRAHRIGSPILYGTSTKFLETFGMNDLGQLPDRDEIVQTLKQRMTSTQSNSPEPEHASQN